jgi:hypothetical protein
MRRRIGFLQSQNDREESARSSLWPTHYKLLIHNQEVRTDAGALVLDAPTLPALRQRLDAWCLESGEVAPVGTGPFRVEDDGTQVEISEEEMDEALGTSFTGLTGAEDD